MPRLNLTEGDFARLMSNLSPTGDAWPTEPDSVRQKALLAFAPTFARLNARANFLVDDAFPATSLELLPEWELSVGLPDPCAGPAPTLQARRKQVVARLASYGGQSKAYLIQYALNLGYVITITEFVPFTADRGFGDGLLWDEWGAYAWQINAPLYTIVYFSADLSAADEPLATYGNTVLECELRAIAPAHTTLTFAYVSGTGVWDGFTWDGGGTWS